MVLEIIQNQISQKSFEKIKGRMSDNKEMTEEKPYQETLVEIVQNLDNSDYLKQCLEKHKTKIILDKSQKVSFVEEKTDKNDFREMTLQQIMKTNTDRSDLIGVHLILSLHRILVEMDKDLQWVSNFWKSMINEIRKIK